MSRRGLPRISGRDALQLAALAATGLVAFNLLVLGALEKAEPAAVGVVVGCVPLVLALAAPLLARRAPVAGVVAAALMVTVGAAVVQGFGHASLAGVLLSLGALVGEALFSLLALALLPRLGPVVLSTYVRHGRRRPRSGRRACGRWSSAAAAQRGGGCGDRVPRCGGDRDRIRRLVRGRRAPGRSAPASSRA